jgi:hypothetical protein
MAAHSMRSRCRACLPGYAGQSRSFRNSAGVKPACRRTGASVPRFTTACWGAAATRPSWFRYTAWLPLVRTYEKPADSGARVTFGTGRSDSAGAHPAPGSRQVVTNGVAVMCRAGSSTSSRYSSTASARFANASSIVCPWPTTSTSRHCAMYQPSSRCSAAVRVRDVSATLEGSRTPSTCAGQREERQPGSPAPGRDKRQGRDGGTGALRLRAALRPYGMQPRAEPPQGRFVVCARRDS